MNIKVCLLWLSAAAMISGLEWFDPSSAEKAIALYFMGNLPLRSTSRTCYFLTSKSYLPGEYNIDIFIDVPTLFLHADTYQITERFHDGVEYKATNLLKLDKGIHSMKYQLYYYGWIRPDCWCSVSTSQDETNTTILNPSITTITTSPLPEVTSISTKDTTIVEQFTTNKETTTASTDKSTIQTTKSTSSGVPTSTSETSKQTPTSTTSEASKQTTTMTTHSTTIQVTTLPTRKPPPDPSR